MKKNTTYTLKFCAHDGETCDYVKVVDKNAVITLVINILTWNDKIKSIIIEKEEETDKDEI